MSAEVQNKNSLIDFKSLKLRYPSPKKNPYAYPESGVNKSKDELDNSHLIEKNGLENKTSFCENKPDAISLERSFLQILNNQPMTTEDLVFSLNVDIDLGKEVVRELLKKRYISSLSPELSLWDKIQNKGKGKVVSSDWSTNETYFVITYEGFLSLHPTGIRSIFQRFAEICNFGK